MINSRIKSLLGESYKRGYELLIKNQLLFNLEQIIDYKTNHNNDNSYLVNLYKAKYYKAVDIDIHKLYYENDELIHNSTVNEFLRAESALSRLVKRIMSEVTDGLDL